MRSLLSLAIFLCFQVAIAQTPTFPADSLSNASNRAATPTKKWMAIERSLDKIAREQPEELQHFLDQLDYSKLNTHHLLLIDAFEARNLIYHGDIEALLELPSKGNPFIKFYQGNGYFTQGKNQLAISLNLEASKLFDYYNDTIYIASCYNNIGAVHWHLNHLDSALYYFQSAKKYTYWHNEMLENNILAIANVLEDEALSLQQIKTISSNSNGSPSPFFLNNAHAFYQDYSPQKTDSLLVYIKDQYPNLSSVPLPILPLFISNQWMTDSLVLKLLDAQPNSYFDRALRELLTAPIIGDTVYTDSTLLKLALKTNTAEDSVLATIMTKLTAEERMGLAESVSSMVDEGVIENSEKLRYAAKEFTETIEEQNYTIKTYGLVIMALFIMGLVLVILQQRRKISQSKIRLELANKNMELAKENDYIQTEIKKARQGIEDIATSSMMQVKKLRKAVDEMGSNPGHSAELMNDLNIITTHEEGMLRFKIKKMVEGLYSASFERVEQHLTQKESHILKLTILEFRSKEIASLLGVSPQHINNVRSKIKTKVEDELKENYEELLETLSREFFLQ